MQRRTNTSLRGEKAHNIVMINIKIIFLLKSLKPYLLHRETYSNKEYTTQMIRIKIITFPVKILYNIRMINIKI